MSVMPGLEEMVTDLSWVEFSDEDWPSCEANSCSYEAVVRSFWETTCPHTVRLYCVKHRDLVIEDIERQIKYPTTFYWVCAPCQDATGASIRVEFINMEPLR